VPVGDLTERRLTHYVGGAWRAPLSDRLVPAAGGPVVAAGPQDAARAFRLTGPGPAPAADLASALAAVTGAEGAAAPHPPAPDAATGRGGRVLILPAPDAQAEALLAAVLEELAAGAGVVLLPPPERALGAMALVAALHHAGLPAGRLSLLQGDAESEAHLTALPFDRIRR
jgi:hypothetical protein